MAGAREKGRARLTSTAPPRSRRSACPASSGRSRAEAHADLAVHPASRQPCGGWPTECRSRSIETVSTGDRRSSGRFMLADPSAVPSGTALTSPARLPRRSLASAGKRQRPECADQPDRISGELYRSRPRDRDESPGGADPHPRDMRSNRQTRAAIRLWHVRGFWKARAERPSGNEQRVAGDAFKVGSRAVILWSILPADRGRGLFLERKPCSPSRHSFLSANGPSNPC